MATAEIDTHLSRRRILVLGATALVVAVVILFAGILPAEYNRDPLGLGRLSGTDKLWAPSEQVVTPKSNGAASMPDSRSYPTTFRSDEVEIKLQAASDPAHNNEVEYKVHLKKGASYVYSWEVSGVPDPEEFYTEFHGHTLSDPKAMTVAYYRKATGTKDNGVLTAPFDGVHGWYFQNQSEKPVTIKVRVAGFYDLIPPGDPGNEGGYEAKRLQ